MTGPNHGIVCVSVDGGTEALVDEYSATRTGDVSVWTSPRLTSGTHTIRVRVTGTQRAAATDKYGVVDRFEIANQPAVGTNYRIVNRNSGKALAIMRQLDYGRSAGRPADRWRRLDHRLRPLAS